MLLVRCVDIRAALALRACRRSRGQAHVTKPVRLRNAWSPDHEYFHREMVGPSHRAMPKAMPKAAEL